MEKNKPIKVIRWGILGLGKIAQKFTKDLSTVEHATLYAVASRNKEKSIAFSNDFNAVKAYDSYELLAQDPDIDAVYIATPHSFHKEHSILCLRQKKAVLCEKPFAMNSKEVEEMINVAKENNTLLMEALWTYFLPHYNFVLDLLKSNKYGKVVELKADFGFYTPFNEQSRVFRKELGGGSLLDIGIYPIFAALTTLGTPKEVEAIASFFENGADAECNMVFHYEDAKAILQSSLLKETSTKAVFTCQKAEIKINSRFHEPSTVTIEENGKEETIGFPCSTFGYNYEIEHFNQLLRDHKKESDIMTFDSSRALIQILDTVRNKIRLKYE